MASFDEHIQQAKKNLLFLEEIASKVPNSIDWQVTTCFYVVVHLADAHIAASENQHYRTHNQVKHSLNPFRSTPSNIPEKPYIAYSALRDLSRRSRYLYNPKENDPAKAYYIYENHLAKAIRHLESFIEFFEAKYSIGLPKIAIESYSVKPQECSHLKIKAKAGPIS